MNSNIAALESFTEEEPIERTVLPPYEGKSKDWSSLEKRTLRGEYDRGLESYQSGGLKKKCYLPNPQIIPQVREQTVTVVGDGFKTTYIKELTPGT